jgi:hypothetical protein
MRPYLKAEFDAAGSDVGEVSTTAVRFQLSNVRSRNNGASWANGDASWINADMDSDNRWARSRGQITTGGTSIVRLSSHGLLHTTTLLTFGSSDNRGEDVWGFVRKQNSVMMVLPPKGMEAAEQHTWDRLPYKIESTACIICTCMISSILYRL